MLRGRFGGGQFVGGRTLRRRGRFIDFDAELCLLSDYQRLAEFLMRHVLGGRSCDGRLVRQLYRRCGNRFLRQLVEINHGQRVGLTCRDGLVSHFHHGLFVVSRRLEVDERLVGCLRVDGLRFLESWFRLLLIRSWIVRALRSGEAGVKCRHGRRRQGFRRGGGRLVISADGERRRFLDRFRRRRRHGCGWSLCGNVLEQLRDFGVPRIGFEKAFVPLPRPSEITVHLGDLAERAQRDEIFGVQLERRGEHVARFVRLAGFVERLAEHNVTTDVTGLSGEVRAADGNSLRRVACLAQLVRERREIAARIFLELRPEFFESRVRHARSSETRPGPGTRVRSEWRPFS